MRQRMAKYAASLLSAQSKTYIPANFEKCCLSVLGSKSDKMEVGFKLEKNQLKLFPTQEGIRLEHPTNCPCRFLTRSDITNLDTKYKTSGVRVGVSFVIQSSDGYILLTRRPKTMRSFPNIWVTPGGHIEDGETLIHAGIREVLEETGISANENHVTTLGLWESVYPPILAMGSPTAHHIVVYMLAQLPEKHNDLKLNLQKEEVSAATWLDEYVVADIVKSDEHGQTRKVPGRYFRARVLEEGQEHDQDIALSTLMACLPASGRWGAERLSSGSKFALRQWLKFRYKTGSKSQNGPLSHADSFETVFQIITKQGFTPKPSPFW